MHWGAISLRCMVSRQTRLPFFGCLRECSRDRLAFAFVGGVQAVDEPLSDRSCGSLRVHDWDSVCCFLFVLDWIHTCGDDDEMN